MTQMTFQNIRNLGANSNQPLITNQNDFQIFDNVTRDHGQAHDQGRRQPDASARARSSTPTRSSATSTSTTTMTSNCAGMTSGCTVNAQHRLRRRELPARLREHQDPQPVRRRAPTPRSGPSSPLYVQDDFRVNSKLTLNLGLRWDVYVPWVEKSTTGSRTSTCPPASSWSPPTTRSIDGVKVGRYLQTYSKTDFGPRFGFAYDVTGNGKTLVRGGFGRVLELHARAARRRRRRRTRRSCSRRRSPRASERTARPALGRPAGAAGRRPQPSRRRDRPARSSTSTSATPTPPTSTSTCSRQLGTNYMVEVAYVGSRGRQMRRSR